MKCQTPYTQSLVALEPTRKLSRAWLKLVAAAVCVVVGFYVQAYAYVYGYFYLFRDELTVTAFSELIMAMFVVGAVAILGGWRCLELNAAKMKEGIKDCRWLLIVDSGIGCLVLLELAAEDSLYLVNNWLANLVVVSVYSLAVGIAEEGMFRALILGGLLDISGKSKRGMWTALIASSLIFGIAHVIPGDISELFDPVQAIQMLLKTIQTGLCALIWGAVLIKQNNMGAAAFTHGLADLFLMLPTALFIGTESLSSTSYVEEDVSDALATCVLYLIIIATYIPLIIKSVHIMAEQRAPYYGPLEEPTRYVYEEAQSPTHESFPVAPDPPMPINSPTQENTPIHLPSTSYKP